MVRSYSHRTDRAGADRPVRVRFDKRDDVDTEKVAEVLIRLALRASDDATAQAGKHLRQLLTPGR
ncbi:hypothetical protein SAMN04488693_109102 [Arthrobacter subterraneus]|uniref:Uncharacterized protein n=1 Tax=Arthrobacter subterraneus TaxID=335973 RepID=A0A1G8JRI2_9MICC|nr:hypothetical protein [Arthrobacter subterraneus]SDI33828.1 hypothetical protein SAMN04488693_109102 [Arthrobacter subterraneus]